MKTAQNYFDRITFFVQVTERDTNGDLETTLTIAELDGVPLENVPAEVLTGPGRETTNSGTTLADVSARITTRWFPGLDSSWVIGWEGKFFNIDGDPDMNAQGHREWRIKAKAGMNPGI